MKVALIGPFPEPQEAVSGGVQRVLSVLAAELAQKVDLTAIVPGSRISGEFRRDGILTIYVQRSVMPGVIRYWSLDAVRVARVLQSLTPDIAHIHASAASVWKPVVPCVFTPHGILHKDIVRTREPGTLTSALLRGAAGAVRSIEGRARDRLQNIVVINPYVREELGDLDRLTTYELPNPLDPLFVQAMNSTAERAKRLLHVGRIGPLKNTLAVIRMAALAIANDPEITLSICGAVQSNAYFDRCLETVAQSGVGDRIRFMGNLCAQDLVSLMDGSGCLLVASLQENSPMGITEAHARGMAVVAPKLFGIRHMIVPGENGLFFHGVDLPSQADTVLKAVATDWDRRSISARVRANHDPVRIASETIRIYRDVLRRSPVNAGIPLN
jgi:glycosyltransferase involved in cell wall biosynthesis